MEIVIKIRVFLLFVITASLILLAGCNPTLEFQVSIEQARPNQRLGKLAYIAGGDVWMMDLDLEQQTRLTRDGYNNSPKWSADGDYLAFLKRGQLWVMEVASEQTWKLNETHTDWFGWALNLPNLAFYGLETGLYIWNPDNDISPFVISPGPAETLRNFYWYLDGSSLFFNKITETPLGTRHAIVDLDIQQGSQNELKVANDGSNFILAGISQESTFLAYWESNTSSSLLQENGYRLCRLNIQELKEQCAQLFMNPNPDLMSWSSQGEIALLSIEPTSVNTRLTVLDSVTLSAQTLGEFLDQPAIYPAWSPNGSQIILSAIQRNASDRTFSSAPQYPHIIRHIWKVDRQLSNAVALTRDERYTDERPMWSGDGREIIFTRMNDQGASLWMMQANGGNLQKLVSELTPLPDPNRDYGYIDWQLVWDWWRPPVQFIEATNGKS